MEKKTAGALFLLKGRMGGKKTADALFLLKGRMGGKKSADALILLKGRMGGKKPGAAVRRSWLDPLAERAHLCYTKPMNHTEFFRLIKEDGLTGAYLLHGPEEYVKMSALSRLTEGVEVHGLNVQTMEAPDGGSVITACETLPFFARRRLVIVKELPAAEEDAIREYLPKVPETALLLLVRRGKADGRNGFYKAFKALGRDVEFAQLSEGEAVRFVQQRAVKRGVTIEPAVARHLVTMVGLDAAALENEIQKAADHAGPGGMVTGETLNACVTRNLDYELFPVLDDLLGGRVREGLKALTAMLRAKSTQPIPAAAALARQCRLALSARLLMDKGMKDERKIAEKMGVSPFFARQAMALARRYDAARLKRALLAFADVEYNIKTGRAAEAFALDEAVWSALAAPANG